MKLSLKYSLICAALLLGMGSSAHAITSTPLYNGVHFQPPPPPPPSHPPSWGPGGYSPHPAPEIDAGMAAGGLTLLAGILVVMRARRRSQKGQL